MPYKSDAQRRFFHTPTARKAGISKATVKEFDSASRGMKLPEKVRPTHKFKFTRPKKAR
jgi:hypothetical protein